MVAPMEGLCSDDCTLHHELARRDFIGLVKVNKTVQISNRIQLNSQEFKKSSQEFTESSREFTENSREFKNLDGIHEKIKKFK